MPLQYQLLLKERGDAPFVNLQTLEFTELDDAKKEARAVFNNARRLARGHTGRPNAVRIVEYEVELWRWTRTEEISAPRGKGAS